MAGPPLTVEEIDLAVAKGALTPAAAEAMKSNPGKFNLLGPGVSASPMTYSAPMQTPAADASMAPNHVGMGPPANPVYGVGGPPAPLDAAPYSPAADWAKAAIPAKPAPAPPHAPSPAPPPLLAKPTSSGPNEPAHKAGSALLGYAGPAAPKTPIDKTAFGFTDHEKKQTADELTHLGAQKGYQEQLSSVDAEQADAFAATAAQMAQDADLRARRMEAEANKRRTFLDRYNANTEEAIDRFARAEIDPNRAFAKAGNGSLFVGMIGVALSGVGQMFKARAGMDPGRNGALDQIEKMVAQDIDLQKASIAKKGAGIEARKGLYASYLQQFGSEDAAEAMAYEAYLRKAKATVDAQMAATGSKEVKIRGAALSESLENRITQFANGRAIVGEKMYEGYLARVEAGKAAAAMEVKKRNQAIVDANLKAVTERITKNGGVVVPAEQPIQLASGAVIPAGIPVAYNAKGEVDLAGTESLAKGPMPVNIPITNMAGGSGTKVVYASDPESKKKIQSATVSVNNYKSAVERMVAAAKKSGPWYVPGYGNTEKANEYDAAAGDALGAYKEMNTLGTLDKGVKEVVSQVLVPTPKVYIKDNEITKLEKAAAAADKVLDSTIKVYGIPVDDQPTPYTAPK